MVVRSVLTAGAEKLTRTQTEELSTPTGRKRVFPDLYLPSPSPCVHPNALRAIHSQTTRCVCATADEEGDNKNGGLSSGSAGPRGSAPPGRRPSPRQGVCCPLLQACAPPHTRGLLKALPCTAEPRKGGRIALDAQCAQEGLSSLWPRVHVS